jgi:PncC family amidohydrolase
MMSTSPFAWSEGTIDAESVAVDTRLLSLLQRSHLVLALAESCTGGLAAKRITDISGSSSVFWGGCVTYSNEAKERLLGVPRKTLEDFGAVSAETVRAMASGLVELYGVDAAVSFSGVAGPDGGSEAKPVGTVWICAALGPRTVERCFHFSGNRKSVRERAATAGFLMLEALVTRDVRQ